MNHCLPYYTCNIFSIVLSKEFDYEDIYFFLISVPETIALAFNKASNVLIV